MPPSSTKVASIITIAAMLSGCAGPQQQPKQKKSNEGPSSEHYSIQESRVKPAYFLTTGELVTLNTDEVEGVILGPKSSFDPNELLGVVQYLTEQEQLFSIDSRIGYVYSTMVTDEFNQPYKINIFLELYSDDSDTGITERIQLLAFEESSKESKQAKNNPAELSIQVSINGRGLSELNVFKTGVIIDQLISIVQLFNNRPVPKSSVLGISNQVIEYYNKYEPLIFESYAYFHLCSSFSNSVKIPEDYLELFIVWNEIWAGKVYDPKLYPNEYIKWQEFIKQFPVPDSRTSLHGLFQASNLEDITTGGLLSPTLHKHFLNRQTNIYTGNMTKAEVLQLANATLPPKLRFQTSHT